MLSGLGYLATTDDSVVAKKYGELAGDDWGHRSREVGVNAAVAPLHAGVMQLAAIADHTTDLDWEEDVGCDANLIEASPIAREVRLFAEVHVSCRRVDGSDVAALARGHTEALALAERELLHPAVGAEDTPVTIDDASRSYAGGRLCLDKLVVLSRWHETQFLALTLGSPGKTESDSLGAHLGLGAAAERKHQP